MKKAILFFAFIVSMVTMAQESPNNGFIPSRVTTTERDAFTNPAKGLIIFNTTTNGLEINSGTGATPVWQVLGASTGSASYGDIKRGVQAADHSGWIKLDGRLKSSLTATQQAEATALGFGANLPNATDAFLVQNGASIGSVSGSNTKTIAQNNLPNVTLSGTTSSSGDHAHTNNSSSSNGGYGIVRTSNGGNNTITDADVSAGEPNILSSAIALTINATGAHTHTLTTSSINGGVAQQTLNITPKSLSVTTFIYLGN